MLHFDPANAPDGDALAYCKVVADDALREAGHDPDAAEPSGTPQATPDPTTDPDHPSLLCRVEGLIKVASAPVQCARACTRGRLRVREVVGTRAHGESAQELSADAVQRTMEVTEPAQDTQDPHWKRAESLLIFATWPSLQNP